MGQLRSAWNFLCELIIQHLSSQPHASPMLDHSLEHGTWGGAMESTGVLRTRARILSCVEETQSADFWTGGTISGIRGENFDDFYRCSRLPEDLFIIFSLPIRSYRVRMGKRWEVTVAYSCWIHHVRLKKKRNQLFNWAVPQSSLCRHQSREMTITHLEYPNKHGGVGVLFVSYVLDCDSGVEKKTQFWSIAWFP